MYPKSIIKINGRNLIHAIPKKNKELAKANKNENKRSIIVLISLSNKI